MSHVRVSMKVPGTLGREYTYANVARIRVDPVELTLYSTDHRLIETIPLDQIDEMEYVNEHH